MGYQTARDMIIAISSGGFVIAFQAVIHALFAYQSNIQYNIQCNIQSNSYSIIVDEFSGVAVVVFVSIWAVVLVRIKNQPRYEEKWRENHSSIVKFILSVVDEDVIAMKPVLEKLEARKFDFNNEHEKVTVEDITKINPVTFKSRFDKFPLIQNILGFITYEQYSALHNYIKYSSLFIDSLCKQIYEKELLQSRTDEAKKILEFFSDEVKNHKGLQEWKDRLST